MFCPCRLMRARKASSSWSAGAARLARDADRLSGIGDDDGDVVVVGRSAVEYQNREKLAFARLLQQFLGRAIELVLIVVLLMQVGSSHV